MESARQRFLAAEDEDELMALQVHFIHDLGQELILEKHRKMSFNF
jgi:hypothetical protein